MSQELLVQNSKGIVDKAPVQLEGRSTLGQLLGVHARRFHDEIRSTVLLMLLLVVTLTVTDAFRELLRAAVRTWFPKQATQRWMLLVFAFAIMVIVLLLVLAWPQLAEAQGGAVADPFAAGGPPSAAAGRGCNNTCAGG